MNKSIACYGNAAYVSTICNKLKEFNVKINLHVHTQTINGVTMTYLTCDQLPAKEFRKMTDKLCFNWELDGVDRNTVICKNLDRFQSRLELIQLLVDEGQIDVEHVEFTKDSAKAVAVLRALRHRGINAQLIKEDEVYYVLNADKLTRIDITHKVPYVHFHDLDS